MLVVLQNRENLTLRKASKEPGGRTEGVCLYSRSRLSAGGPKGGVQRGKGKRETAELDRRGGLHRESDFLVGGVHRDFRIQKGANRNPK